MRFGCGIWELNISLYHHSHLLRMSSTCNGMLTESKAFYGGWGQGGNHPTVVIFLLLPWITAVLSGRHAWGGHCKMYIEINYFCQNSSITLW